MPEVDQHDLFEVATLVYRRWAEEFDLLKKVKAETDNGKEDWAELHQARLTNHSAAEAKWKGILNRISAKLPRLV